jgi:DNA-directed RNA polymerase specialized sigma24 family protein
MFWHDQVDVRHFYDRWGPTVLRFCQLYLGDLEQAESATREAFVGFFKGTFDRKSKKLPIGLMQLAVAASRSRCLTLGEHNGTEGLEACVRSLPYQQRSVFLMRGTFNLTAREIAEITDTTVNEVNKLFLEALLSLRHLWLKKSWQGDI